MDINQSLRSELIKLISGGTAHAGLREAVKAMPANLRGVRTTGAPHSAWELLEHLRIAQWDMLEFSRNPGHESPEWPGGYWPASPEPPDPEAWDKSVAQFRADNEAMQKLIGDPRSDLFTPFPHGEGQTLLREALQLADHNSYHIGELIFLRRLLGAWPGEKA
ncbi:MAG TPA: DinB family protein [Bryobacteraceae bacterium]|nr:DinB family protein [Bryobacteraceae bacterium]